MEKSKIVLVLGCGMLAACSSEMTGPRYTAREYIPLKDYAESDFYNDHIDRVAYNEYEERESCQHYRAIPRNSLEKPNCLVRKAPPPPAPIVALAPPPPPPPMLQPIIKTYTLYFDFDRSNVRADQVPTIDQVAKEIDTYKPTQITVTGFTDTAGSKDYNMQLSEKRAHAVTKALSDRNIPSQEVSQDARGESDLAVETKDGVPKQENRRTVVDFRAQVPMNQ